MNYSRLLIVTLCVCFGASVSQSQSYTFSKLDGNYWKGIENIAYQWLNGLESTQNRAKPTFTDDTYKGLAHQMKYYFISGIEEMAFCIDLPPQLFVKWSDKGKTQLTPYTVDWSSEFTSISTEQVVQGLDKFYEDYRNIQIRIKDAIDIVSIEIKGGSQTNIDWWTRYYRASPEMRVQMLDESQTQKK